MSLEFFAVKTGVLFPPKDNVFGLFENSSLSLKNKDILCIATKCLSIHQGRCIKIGSVGVNKQQLIIEESDRVLKSSQLTIKDGVIIPFSGIDESNGNGYYVLWPHNVIELLCEIHEFLCKKFAIHELGVISVDSKIEPLRRGTVGVSQEIFGFNPLKRCEGDLDIFGRKLELTSVNLADSLAATACYLMGEGSECCPIVVIRGINDTEFSKGFSRQNLSIPESTDMFSCLL